ncbi:sigma-70 family RNA polymerase sigma factor [Fimbriiglobus ruber]|uniref:Uncharacterized protein n=1 Tax=Fimbriiglobus ruber TaxID=1908690 RepID=A0A225DFT4_9BACT|nr:sigma-70 family RNA polymerase sigma factor [Fimbriiglobus ruber]OWK34947.1 hypothetical protein FRUB_09789 [Fimbriiglobus ruber]
MFDPQKEPTDPILLAAKYDPLARKIAGRFHHQIPAGADYTDLLQESRLAVYLSAERFKPELGLQFSTLAVACAIRRILDFLRRERRGGFTWTGERKAGHVPPKVLDQRSDADGFPALFDASYDPEDAPIEWNQAEWQAVLGGLKERTRRAVYLKFKEGRTLEEIGAELRISKERVRQLISDGLERLRMQRADLIEELA